MRGGAWSAIGKRIEKPLLIKLCNLCGVLEKNYDTKGFIKDKNKLVDREVDFEFYGKNGEKYFCEVKLMGAGNPESADTVIARNSNILVADTLSKQNKNQLNSLGIYWLELKNHNRENIVLQFKKILSSCNISFEK